MPEENGRDQCINQDAPVLWVIPKFDCIKAAVVCTEQMGLTPTAQSPDEPLGLHCFHRGVVRHFFKPSLWQQYGGVLDNSIVLLDPKLCQIRMASTVAISMCQWLSG